MIKIDNLHLSLEGGAGMVNILRGIDLQVARGETLSIVGSSGAGKTTLLMVLSGLEQATSGSVIVSDVDISQLNEDQLARFRRQNIGIVFQSFHLIPTMTALENVALPLEFSGIDQPLEQAEKALCATGLKDRLQHYPGELSGGEQQRVALARAFVVQPALILADEPTGNLDQDTGAQVMENLFALHREFNTTMVLVTHDLNLARQCDRSLEMRDGVLLESETVDA
jgi:putative ABC transport system ATP-binding protein